MICEIKEYFFVRPGSAYIFVQIGNQKRQQICEGGKFRGETISYLGDDDVEFEKICLKWYRQNIKIWGVK
jgi:hypothetical protein